MLEPDTLPFWPYLSWQFSDEWVEYEDALARMESEIINIQHNKSNGLIWFLEHPALITAGSSAKSHDLLPQNTLPVYHVGRGGQYTYHGPGQRIIYLMLDLKAWRQDVRCYIQALERWIIMALQALNIHGVIESGRVGVWVDNTATGGQDKIAAIGVRLKRWVTMHGIAINYDPNLSHYQSIVPCGIHDKKFGITSIKTLNPHVKMEDLDAALIKNFAKAFTVG